MRWGIVAFWEFSHWPQFIKLNGNKLCTSSRYGQATEYEMLNGENIHKLLQS